LSIWYFSPPIKNIFPPRMLCPGLIKTSTVQRSLSWVNSASNMSRRISAA